MEDNNNIIIVKGLAIILIAILGFNLYRTETMKKEMAQLASTVELLSAQMDSLDVYEAQAGTTPAVSAAATGPSSSSRRVSVTAKVKVENRYVRGTTYLPKVTTGPAGVVVINVSIQSRNGWDCFS